MIYRLLGVFSLLLLLALPAFATGQSFSSNNDFSGLETAEFLPVEEAYQLELDIETQTPGLRFTWLLADNYFLYKHGFKLQWHQGTGNVASLDVEQLAMPAGLKKDDEYFGQVEIYYQQLDFVLNADQLLLKDETQALYLKASSQGCADAGLCYPPYALYFKVDFSDKTISRIDAEQFVKAQTPIVITAIQASPHIDKIDSVAKLFWVLLAAFAGGMILNLMPCVLPVLSIKVMQLARQHEVSSARKQGVAYMAGVVLSFMVIAAVMLAVRASGNAVGWGFQLQNPLFVSLLVYLFFILALSMSGLVAFGQRWMGAGQALTERGGLQGAFFTGVLAVVVASPCTAPFMGGALGYAVTEPPVIGLSIFAALGLGMSLPIALVSFIPAASALLPKPGLWMERLKQFFAFPLYATSVWLLWVLGNQTSTLAMAMMLLGCIAMTMAFWCFKSQKALSRVVGLISLLAALMVPFSAHIQPKGDVVNNEQIAFTREALDDLREQGIPVFVDLTADWCITCIANEQATLNTDEVRAAFKHAGIVYMVGDWTYPNPEISALLSEHHRSGIPLYLLYPATPNAPAIILPQVLSSSIILDAIKNIK